MVSEEKKVGEEADKEMKTEEGDLENADRDTTQPPPMEMQYVSAGI